MLVLGDILVLESLLQKNNQYFSQRFLINGVLFMHNESYSNTYEQKQKKKNEKN